MRRIEGYGSAFTIIVPTIVSIAFAALLGGCGGDTSATFSSEAPVTLDSIQRQIAALPCPPGVSHELWDTLTSELMGQLTRRASTEALVAGPPLDDLSKVDDLSAVEDPLGSIRLRWSYRNTGDYDQNSETNISDLTPIGRHFNKTPASQDWQTARVADGDLNGEVNISDVTPIGRCFLQTVTEYRVEYSATGATGSKFAEFGTAAFDSASPGGDGWLSFDTTLGGAQGGYYRVVPYYHSERGIAGESVYFAGNQPPKAALTADPLAGRTPLTVNFDASESSDPEHGALTYYWDWEGDGVWDQQSTTAVQQHEYTADGQYTPWLKVADSESLEDTVSVTVRCNSWQVYEIAPNLTAFKAALIAGKPALVYSGHDNEIVPGQPITLRYAHSNVDEPVSADDWTLSVVEPSTFESENWVDTGSTYPTLFELDGRPAIIHYIPAGRYAWYLDHATTPTPNGPEDWVVSKICEDTGFYGALMGPDCTPLVIDDRIYCFFLPFGEPEVRLARALVEEPAGPADWEITTVALTNAADIIPSCMSAGYIGGKLSVAFQDVADYDLAFASTSNLQPQGPEDWQQYVLDSQGSAGLHVKMVSMEGCSVIVSRTVNFPNPEAVRLARAKVPAPQSLTDWKLSTAATGPSFIFLDFEAMGSSCVVFTTNKRENNKRQLIALYPSSPGAEGLDLPWACEEVNPDLPDDNTTYPTVLVSGNSLVCIYGDNSILDPGDGYSLKCATAFIPRIY